MIIQSSQFFGRHDECLQAFLSYDDMVLIYENTHSMLSQFNYVYHADTISLRGMLLSWSAGSSQHTGKLHKYVAQVFLKLISKSKANIRRHTIWVS